MLSLNRVMLIGHLTRNPEVTYLASGTAICNFTIAINTKMKDRDDETYFASITAFGTQAETIGRYIKKGDPIYIEGKLKRENWEDSSGNKKEKTKIIMNTFQFLKSKSDGQQPQQQPQKQTDVPF